MLHKELDTQIRKLLFQKRKQDPYSTDRRYSAMVVDEIGKQSTEIVDRFNGFIDKEWQAVCDTFKVEHMDTPSWNTFLLWATPDIICRAAIYSFSRRISKEMS